MQVPMTEVIAVRRFWWEGEPERQLLVSVGKPAQTPGMDGLFYCPIQTSGFGDDDRVEGIFGVDAFEAIEFAVQYVSSKMFAINAESGGRLRWEFGNKGLVPQEWKQKPTRIALNQQLSCENGHQFIFEAGLVQNRHTQEVSIQCPTCGTSVGGLGPDYPREWLPSQLRQCTAE